MAGGTPTPPTPPPGRPAGAAPLVFSRTHTSGSLLHAPTPCATSSTPWSESSQASPSLRRVKAPPGGSGGKLPGVVGRAAGWRANCKLKSSSPRMVHWGLPAAGEAGREGVQQVRCRGCVAPGGGGGGRLHGIEGGSSTACVHVIHADRQQGGEGGGLGAAARGSSTCLVHPQSASHTPRSAQTLRAGSARAAAPSRHRLSCPGARPARKARTCRPARHGMLVITEPSVAADWVLCTPAPEPRPPPPPRVFSCHPSRPAPPHL